MTQPLLVFPHLPKTAGSSFVESLRQHFGNAHTLSSFDLPMNTPVADRQRHALDQAKEIGKNGVDDNIAFIHGHFLPVKYHLLEGQRPTTYVTWMRHPADRLRSNWFYWQRSLDVARPEAALHRRVIDEQWSFERFCLGDEMRDMYAQFLWQFPLSKFDFIGITEHYDDDFAYFSDRYLDGAPQAPSINIDPDGHAHQSILDAGLRSRIETFHAKDMQIYREALARRARRAKPYSQNGMPHFRAAADACVIGRVRRG